MPNEHTPQREYEPAEAGTTRASAASDRSTRPSARGPDDLVDHLKSRGGDIVLTGEVSERMARDCADQLRDAEEDDSPLVVEVTTTGGDAEMARRIVTEVDRTRRRIDRRLVFLGTSVVYSAGTTIMSAFPRADRFFESDAMLMIHCRQLTKTVELDGPIRASKPRVEALLRQIEVGLDLEMRNFRRLVEGSDVSLEELGEKALYNWYLTAHEARERGLIGVVV